MIEIGKEYWCIAPLRGIGLISGETAIAGVVPPRRVKVREIERKEFLRDGVAISSVKYDVFYKENDSAYALYASVRESELFPNEDGALSAYASAILSEIDRLKGILLVTKTQG